MVASLPPRPPVFSWRALSSFVVISSVCIHHGFLPDYTATLGAEVLLKEQLLKYIQARAGASMSGGGSCGEGEWRVRQTRFLSSALTSPAWCSAMRGTEKEPAWSIISPVPEREGGRPSDYSTGPSSPCWVSQGWLYKMPRNEATSTPRMKAWRANPPPPFRHP